MVKGMWTVLRAATVVGLAPLGLWAQYLPTLISPPPSRDAAEGVRYEDVTARSGLDSFRHRAGNPNKPYLPETLGSGVALFDYDNDGWLDIYLVTALASPEQSDRPDALRSALFRNNRAGTFVDVTARAGVENRRWGVGVCAGYFDNDGWQDLFVTNLGESRLYENNGDGSFRDIASQAEVEVEGWATGCAFGDYDRDGLLDLYVARYVKFDWKNPPPAGGGADQQSSSVGERPNAGRSPAMGAAYNPGQQACRFLGVTVACGPMGLPAAPDALFHNEGNGRFRDVTRQSKVSAVTESYGLAVGWVDVDSDGWLDIVVANDSQPNFLFHNKADGTFEEVGMLSGLAVNGDGHEQAYMGMAVGDYNRDGHPDFFFTTFSSDNYATAGTSISATRRLLPGSRRSLRRFWVGELHLSTTTTTGCLIFSRSMGTSSRRRTRRVGERLICSARCCCGTAAVRGLWMSLEIRAPGSPSREARAARLSPTCSTAAQATSSLTI
jgi:hypothetical protein